MFREMNVIRELATKYSKPQLANLVQTGQLEPQKAVMAGMLIDRIAKSAMAPPQTTVAQDVLGQSPTAAGQGMPPQMGQMPQGAPQMPPQMAAHGGIMGMMPHSDGLAALPSGLHDMAGGGIVAFADGGPSYLPEADYAHGKVPIYTSKAPEQVDLAKAAGMRTESERQAGFDPDMYKKLRDEEMAGKEDLAKQREEAKGMAALQFGLGLMGARKGQEFQTASAAGQQALSQYGSAIKDIKASEKEMKKTMRELTVAENAYKKSNADRDLAKVDDAKNRLQIHQENIAKSQNEAVKTGADLFKNKYQVDEHKATQLAVADITSKTSFGVAQLHERGADRRATLPGEQERIINNMLESLRKTNPDATYADAVQAVKSASGTSASSLADKAYDNVMKRAQVDMAFQMQINKDPSALQAAVDAETRRIQAGGGGGRSSTPAPGGQRGQVDIKNPLLAG
jgi:hypothetical protein